MRYIRHTVFCACLMGVGQAPAQQRLQDFASLIKLGVHEVCATVLSDVGQVESSQLYAIDSIHVLLRQMNRKGRVMWIDTINVDSCLQLPFLPGSHFPQEIGPCSEKFGANGTPSYQVDSLGRVVASTEVSAVDIQKTSLHRRFYYQNHQLDRSIEWTSKYGQSMGDTAITTYEYVQGLLHRVRTSHMTKQLQENEVLYEYSPSGLLLHVIVIHNGRYTHRTSFTYIIR